MIGARASVLSWSSLLWFKHELCPYCHHKTVTSGERTGEYVSFNSRSGLARRRVESSVSGRISLRRRSTARLVGQKAADRYILAELYYWISLPIVRRHSLRLICLLPRQWL